MSTNSDDVELQASMEKIIQRRHYEYFDTWINNFVLNLEYIWKEPSAKILEPNLEKDSHFLNSSAIVIGRGPSLKKQKHLELLANSNYRGMIIACDGILIEALKSGVTPDKFPNFYVVTIDYAPTFKKFYDDELVDKFGKKIKGIFTTITDPDVVERARRAGIKIHWIHPLFDYNEGKKSFNYITSKMVRVKKREMGLPAIQTGGNVGTTAWFISWLILKCKTVSLIGINHAWEESDGWEKIITHNNDLPIKMEKTDPVFNKLFEKGHNPGFNCDFVLDPMFRLYSMCLKEFIIRSPDWVNTINATEGGSIFGDRITCKNFKQFLDDEESNP